MKKICALILTLIFSCETVACVKAPEEFSWSVNKMVHEFPNILIIEPISAKENTELGNYEFEVKVIENLKGNIKENFKINGYLSTVPVYDFNSHRNSEFWKVPFSGNAVMPGDCGAYGKFKIGEQYLVFLGDFDHPKSQERIVTKKDKWLLKVKSVIK